MTCIDVRAAVSWPTPLARAPALLSSVWWWCGDGIGIGMGMGGTSNGTLYLVGLGLGGADDITLRGLNCIKRCSKLFLEAYTAIMPFGGNNNSSSYDNDDDDDDAEKEEGEGKDNHDGEGGALKTAAVLEAAYGLDAGSVRIADRETVESGCEEAMLGPCTRGEDVALLVVGDPFSATTHTDLQLRAAEAGVTVEVVHNASVMTAVGACGLQLYRFGETISIVFFTDTWRPDSFYDKIKSNRAMVRIKREREKDFTTCAQCVCFHSFFFSGWT